MNDILTLKQLKQVVTSLPSQSKIFIDGKEVDKISVQAVEGEYVINFETKLTVK